MAAPPAYCRRRCASERRRGRYGGSQDDGRSSCCTCTRLCCFRMGPPRGMRVKRLFLQRSNRPRTIGAAFVHLRRLAAVRVPPRAPCFSCLNLTSNRAQRAQAVTQRRGERPRRSLQRGLIHPHRCGVAPPGNPPSPAHRPSPAPSTTLVAHTHHRPLSAKLPGARGLLRPDPRPPPRACLRNFGRGRATTPCARASQLSVTVRRIVIDLAPADP